VLRMESEVVTLQDVFLAKPPDEDSGQAGQPQRLLSPLTSTGLKPSFLDKMSANGVNLPPNFFERDDTVYRPSFSAATFGGYR
jgi:hypothetical protein